MAAVRSVEQLPSGPIKDATTQTKGVVWRADATAATKERPCQAKDNEHGRMK